MPELTDVISELRRYGYNDDQIIAYLQQQGINAKDILDAIKKLKVPSEEKVLKDREKVEGEREEEKVSIMERPAEIEEIPTPSPIPAPVLTPTPKPAKPSVIPAVPFTQEIPSTMPATPTMVTTPETMQAMQYPTFDIETIEAMIEEMIKERWEVLRRRIGDIEELKKQIDEKIGTVEDRLKKVELSLDKIYLTILKRQEEQVKEIKSVGKEINMLEEAFGKILIPLSENIKKLEEISKEIKKK